MNFYYLKYRFKAKGRHGTHSPFVYAFVEKVLRKQKLQQAFKNTSKERILLQLIDFLKITQLYFFPDAISVEIQHIQSLFPKLKIIEISSISLVKDFENTLVLLDIEHLKQSDFDLLQQLKEKENFSIYLNNIHHQNQTNHLVWNKVKEYNNFPMSLDFWIGGLLIQQNSFKIKQHFLLK